MHQYLQAELKVIKSLNLVIHQEKKIFLCRLLVDKEAIWLVAQFETWVIIAKAAVWGWGVGVCGGCEFGVGLGCWGGD